MKLTLPSKNDDLIGNTHCKNCNAPLSADLCAVCGAKLDRIEQHDKALSRSSILYEGIFVLLPLGAFILWFFSLRFVDVQHMTDLGLVSVLPAATIFALVVLVVSFCVTLNRQKLSEPILVLHILLLIFMLYSVTTLVEQQPRFSTVYQHAGYTEFIMRTGSVNPYLDAYFNWPGFFLLSAFLNQIAGYQDILNYATWAPVYYNLFYLIPLYIIFTTATTNKRVIWLALCFFYLTNWIAQDYYSPQGLNFFLYLLVIAILLKWFKKPLPASPDQQAAIRRRLGRLTPVLGPVYEWLTAPDELSTPVQPLQKRALLASIIIIFAFMVFSHPLTPFLMIVAVVALVIFGRITPFWLPILMIVMTGAWDILMAQPYLSGHLTEVLSDIGQLGRAVSSNVTDRLAAGDTGHVFIGEMRTIMTFLIWCLAALGAFHRLRRGYHDASYVLLAIVAFPIVLIQSYGGEMLLRIYLFTLPMMVFFAASLFYTPSDKELSASTKTWYQPSLVPRKEGSTSFGAISPWMKGIIVLASVVLLAGFLFTRYGNERVDYVTNAELTGLHHLYSIAPSGSTLIAGWDGTPWNFQDIDLYNIYTLDDNDNLARAVIKKDVAPVIQLIESSNAPKAYVIFDRGQQAAAQSAGLPPGTLTQLEHALLTSQKFVLVYSNSDTQIFQFTG